MIYNYHVRLARSALNLTQGELAKKSGVQHQQLRILSYQSQMRSLKIAKL